MSTDGAVSKAELALWLRERVAQLEDELRYLRALLEAISGGGGGERDPRRARPGERVEEVRVGRRRIARVFKGEDYVRLAPLVPLVFPREVRGYIDAVIGEIRAEQARAGREDRLARLEVRSTPDGGLEEILVDGLHNTLEQIKAKTALKHAAELAWQYTRAARKARG